MSHLCNIRLSYSKLRSIFPRPVLFAHAEEDDCEEDRCVRSSDLLILWQELSLWGETFGHVLTSQLLVFLTSRKDLWLQHLWLYSQAHS